jgi:hypothetical protein
MQASPKGILEKLSAILPEFAIRWAQHDNLFTQPNGAFTYCGLFMELTAYICDHFSDMSERQREALFKLVEDCITNDLHDDLDNAICTCFLENLAGEPPRSTLLRTYMRSKSREFFDLWNHTN